MATTDGDVVNTTNTNLSKDVIHSGTSVMGVEWAPLSLPLERRLQTLAVCLYMSLALFLGLCSTAGLAYVFFFTQYAWVAVLYLTWMVYDWNIGEEGGREWT